MTKYRFVKEERANFTVWYTEVGTWFLWWNWEIDVDSISADYEVAKLRYQHLLKDQPLKVKTVLCNQ